MIVSQHHRDNVAILQRRNYIWRGRRMGIAIAKQDNGTVGGRIGCECKECRRYLKISEM